VTQARQGLPHPDPSVVRVAAAAAHAVGPWYEVAFTVCLAAATALAVGWRFASGPLESTGSLVSIGVLLASLVGSLFVIFGRWGIWPPTAARLEAVGVRQAMAHRPVAPPVSLTIPTSPRRWRLYLVLGALLLVFVVAVYTKVPAPWWARALQLAGTAIGVVCGLLLNRALHAPPPWARRRPRAGSPVLTLDDTGVALPHLGVAMPWPQVAGVVAVAVDRAGVSLIVWNNAVPPTTVGVPAEWLSLPVEDVVAAARDHVAAARATAAAGN
jgi:hypothetical protein